MPNNIGFGQEERLTDAEKEDPTLIKDPGIGLAPEGPIKLVMDEETGLLVNCLYGDFDRMMNGELVGIWNEEILRDPETKAITAIRTTRVNGTITREDFIRDETTGKLIGTKMVFESEL